jgi:hypothetical protein
MAFLSNNCARVPRPSCAISTDTACASRAKTMNSKDHDVIIAEIHHAINKLGGSAHPATPDEAQRALRHLGADIDLISIVDSWQDTLPDEDILQLIRNWNAGRPLFQTVYASRPEDDN